MTGTGLLMLAVGLVLIGVGGGRSRAAVEQRLGELTPEAIEAAEGTGVVPVWVSVMVLAGWLAALVGIALVVWGLVFA